MFCDEFLLALCPPHLGHLLYFSFLLHCFLKWISQGRFYSFEPFTVIFWSISFPLYFFFFEFSSLKLNGFIIRMAFYRHTFWSKSISLQWDNCLVWLLIFVDLSIFSIQNGRQVDSWELWNTFRLLCGHHNQLFIALDVLWVKTNS